MINAALAHLASQLNQSLKREYSLAEDIVVVSNIVEPNGSVAPNVSNKLVMLVANIEKDTVPQHQSSQAGSGRIAVGAQPLFLNLYVMVAANFNGTSYPEALKLISSAISFFQRQAVFDHQSTPDLDPRIERLILDLENLKIQDLNNVWGLLSGKYLPSVLYKVRMITIDSAMAVDQVPTLRAPRVATHQE
ncbi:DUF4255 domain-containing protein [Oxalicibacterium solurbis]|uniref:Pvc16 N-terminal domain-containing protein n=1 Tax=Oxalicibacterium solurbis TaxID=69280 RepID=A0A8J3AXI5_9BURK|nr:DUF4255 domain-containing protein [Oxalicibacterium solurbis]GGI52872.1 hypothetical protein GCM10011430_00460 [Oxalicibacterium solurbis]